MKIQNPDNNNHFNTILKIVFLVAIAVLYLVFFGRYRTEYIDNAWTLSWAYNYWENGTVFDPVFGYENGDGGSALFSRGYVLVYGAFCSLFDWSRFSGMLLSKLFFLGSVVCWYFIIKKLKYSESLAFWFCAVMMLLEIYFGMSEKLRVDSMTFFLATAGFLLFVDKRFLFSGFFLVAAVENHPYALIFFLYCLAYVLSILPEIKKEPKAFALKAMWFICGCLLGTAYYLFLHWRWLGGMDDVAGRVSGNAFWEYYIAAKYAVRHLPELVILIASVVILVVKKIYKEDRFLLLFLVFMIAGSFILMRANYHYVVYLYPPVILTILIAFERVKMRNLLLVALLIFQLPVYSYLFWSQKGYRHKAYLENLTAAVGETSDMFIYGNASAWYALKDRNFHAYGYWDRSSTDNTDGYPAEILTIEDHSFRNEGYKQDFHERLGNEYSVTEIAQFEKYDGSNVFIRLYVKRNRP